MEQTIRFATTPDEVKLAFATSGAGWPLLKTANWLNHIEFDWQSPVWAHWFSFFSSRNTLYRYDGRGSGLSDWKQEKLDFEQQVLDLEFIADNARLERFALLGISQGASVAIEYAARYPERVSHLVICGGFARGWAKRGPEAERAGRVWVELMRVGWGTKAEAYRRMFAELFIPKANARQVAWFAEMQRRTTTPEIAARTMEAWAHIDVVARLRDVKVPTLVLHSRHDLVVPFEQGRTIAAGIPDARFVEFPSSNHLLLEEEASWHEFQRIVGEFLSRPTHTTRGAGHGVAAHVYPSLPSAESLPTAPSAPVSALPSSGAANSNVGLQLAALTAREREILTLVAKGANNQDIASQLFISDKTVRNHLTSIFDKLGVHSRAQAIVFSRDRGITG